MKAAIYRSYGAPDVVRVEEVAKPKPKSHEVLIRVHATTVSSGDWRARSLKVPAGFGLFVRPVFGVFSPRKKILGTELAGVIEEVGSAVTRFKVGDAVFAFPGFGMGSHAEYRTMPEDGRLLALPRGLDFKEAAALCFGGTTALTFLRDLARIQPGEDVLVIGASGAVGSAAVQIAKHLGARVTGVSGPSNQDLVRSLGAEHAIDYSRQDYRTSGATYDVIFDTVGNTTFAQCAPSLKKGGRLLLCAAGLFQIIGSAWAARGTGKRSIAGNAAERLEDLLVLKEFVEIGAFRPLVDRVFPLAQIAEAHAYAESGHKRGSVVVTI